MLPDYVKERTFLVATPMGSWTTQGRKPWDAVVLWAYKADLEVENFPKEVAENFWICSLIDEEQEFDVWIVDLEPEKKRSPIDDPTAQVDENLDNKKPITVRYAKDMPINDYQVITKDGMFSVREIRPLGAIRECMKNRHTRAGQRGLTKVADDCWFFVLIDENDEPFDCWVRQL